MGGNKGEVQKETGKKPRSMRLENLWPETKEFLEKRIEWGRKSLKSRRIVGQSRPRF